MVLAGAGGAQQQSTDAQQPPIAKRVVNQYCTGCHNGRVKSGGLSLDGVNPEIPGNHADIWERVVRKLRARHMPPPGLPRPDEKTYDAVITSLENDLDRKAAASPNPGRSDAFRRLNRTEYKNAIRDLLAIEIDVTSLLPSDETALGFDNITLGELSPTLLDRYLNAAQKISRLAIGAPIKSPIGDTVQLAPDFTQESGVDGLPFGTRGGAMVKYLFPLDAEYDFQVRLARDRDSHVEGLNDNHQLEISMDGERLKVFPLQPPRDQPDHFSIDKDLRLRIPVKAGPHMIGATFVKKTSALLETELKPLQVHFNMDRHPRVQPAIYQVQIYGPYNPTGPGNSPSRQRVYVCQPENAAAEDGCATRILSTLARRAYRRPVSTMEVAELMKFYKEGRAQAGFDSGIEMALRALLVSPKFLFRVERDPAGVAAGAAYRLSDVELASRISFLLWSSIPDDELINVAEQGKLKDPAILEKQVRRMLADERSEALVTNFADQWLYLRNLDFMVPDPRTFPDFDDNLRQSLRRETHSFVESIIREDRNVLDLLGANYTFLNERLAKHYGIPNVYGDRMRKVEFGSDDVRGGLLSQGSLLMVTSYATRTSPVIRGKWILSNLLASAPPPPPPVVPELKPSTANGRFVTIKERLAEHRDNPACSGCHRLMDPLGFALENYDAIGRWRTQEGGVSIDASGNLPDGRELHGVAGLKQALLARPELFVSAMTEKLLTYALGREMEPYDAPAVRKIVRESRATKFRFSSLILGVVKSTPFQMRRSQ